jgi:acyl carrier protein
MDFNMNFNKDNMLEKLQIIFHDIFDIDPKLITTNTTIDNLDEWDSMKHLELIMEIEKVFHVDFVPHEIILLNSVERIMTSLVAKAQN